MSSRLFPREQGGFGGLPRQAHRLNRSVGLVRTCRSTPTHGSWLNQVEVWFSIMARAVLRGASFTHPREIRQAIDDFIEV